MESDKIWKSLVESGKSWWKVGKSEKPGGKWKNFVKVWKVEKFVKMCETLENLSKNEKILKRQKMENWKILEKPGGNWKNLKNWCKVGKFGKSLKSGKILNLWNFGKSVKKWKNIEKAKNRQLENSGKTCWKWKNVKNLVESGKNIVNRKKKKLEKFC